jgi:hypothetical protein
MNSPIDFFALTAAVKAASLKKSKFRPRRTMHALESRIVFDGALATALVDPNHLAVTAVAKAVAAPAVTPVDLSKAVATAPIAPATHAQPVQIVFIESNVANYQTMLKDFNLAPGTEVHVLDANQDGLTQMAQILAGRSGIGAIQIGSHGTDATVQLGSLNLNAQTLQTRHLLRS